MKAKMHSGQQVRQASAPHDATREQMEAIVKKQGAVDLFHIDGQHSAMPTERELVRFCNNAAEIGVGVQIRMPHPKLAFLTGRYADLGILSLYVPLGEDEETVTDAINNFYFPPLGNRSWGGNLMVAKFGVGGGQAPPPYTEQMQYAQWWNRHCCLGRRETFQQPVQERRGSAQLHHRSAQGVRRTSARASRQQAVTSRMQLGHVSGR